MCVCVGVDCHQNRPRDKDLLELQNTQFLTELMFQMSITAIQSYLTTAVATYFSTKPNSRSFTGLWGFAWLTDQVVCILSLGGWVLFFFKMFFFSISFTL